MLRICCLLLLTVQAWSCQRGQPGPAVTDPLASVNPFIGTGGHGHTFPGATVPFGMVQLSPDTRLDGWDGCSGYHYTDTVVYGFTHTHLSGTGISDYGDVLLMPTVGAIQLDNGAQAGHQQGYASAFDKDEERASPGYYRTLLADYGIEVELTAGERSGFHRYVFPAGVDTGNVILDLLHRDRLIGDSLQLDHLAAGEISGYRNSQAWAPEQPVYFVIQFSVSPQVVAQENRAGRPVKLGLRVALPDSAVLLVKVGISAVSVANARENLLTDIPHWDFAATRARAEAMWAAELGKIEVEGGTPAQRTNFYTALYHCFVAPNLWSDANGEYLGMDRQVHRAAPGQRVYTVFSLWDTFRANHPLFTLVQQDRTNAFIRTFLLHYQQGGRLPVWELAANETECMIGYHSVSVATDAYVKGLRDWDANLMLEAMAHGANLDHFGLASYRAHGCILAADEAESVSKTLEYAYDDWCIAQLALELGADTLYQTFMQRAQYYKNLYDPSTGFFRARVDGNWFGPFDPAEVNFNYTEANAWQYSLFVPQDLTGLMRLMGGPDSLEAHLDRLFGASSATTGREQADITGLIGQYAHGNEPSHHMAYLYNYVGKPWKTQQRVRQILNELYTAQPDGLSGNEDCGQMSAWYVFSALGLYPVTPGLPQYALSAPLFERAVLHLENGRDLVIEAPGAQQAGYVREVRFNGAPHPQSFVTHADLMEGGVLSFVLDAEPQTHWAAAVEQSGVTAITYDPITPTPVLVAESVTFIDSLTVRIESACSDCRYFYSLGEAGQVQTYTAPFVLKASARVKAWAEAPSGRRSRDIGQQFHRIKGGRHIDLQARYANQYAAGGDHALIDYLRGSSNFRTGRWQGYEGQKFVATVDLGALQRPQQVGVGFLQDIGSWIFYPPTVRFWGSADGTNFVSLGAAKNRHSDREEMASTQDYSLAVQRPLRYLRVEADNYGPCPPWHLGAGGKTWLFVDEIWVKPD